MKLNLEMIKENLKEKEGYFEAVFQLEKVENLDEVENIAEKEGYDIWWDVTDNKLVITHKDVY